METNHCPTCHAPIPANAPGGFCPACILRDVEELPTQGHGAPLIGEIATAFSQLEVLELIGQGGMGFVSKVRQAMRAGRFTPQQALAIVPSVCDALQYAHEHGVKARRAFRRSVLLIPQSSEISKNLSA